MYSIQQLQAFDFLLERITRTQRSNFFGKNLKLVINLEGQLFFGDFIKYDDGVPYQSFIDDSGDVEPVHFYADGTNATGLLQKTWETLTKTTSPRSYWSNPLFSIKDLELFFDTLLKIIELADVKDEPTPFYPYLLNATSLDKSIKLPFINLKDKQIDLVSLIEIN